MRHLFEDWNDIQRRIQEAPNVFLFLDYDGTLTPIVATPDLAFCPPEVRAILAELRDLSKIYVAIISGRSLEDVREKVGIPGIIYVGNHGLEIENPAGRHKKKLTPPRAKELEVIKQNIQDSLAGISGILFEDKGPILTVHYRNVLPEYFQLVGRVVAEGISKWKDRWKIARGKMVFEIRPKADFSKGKAVRELFKSLPTSSFLPVYLGDDQTDEDAFRAIKGKGIAVLVGEQGHSSEAGYYLQDPAEVWEFLQRCLTILGK